KLPTDPSCSPPAPDAKATLNGVVLERTKGMSEGTDTRPAYNRDCLIEFSTRHSVVGAGGAWLRIEDASAAWVLHIPDAFASRTLGLVSSKRVLRPRQRIVAKWAPASDVVEIESVSVRGDLKESGVSSASDGGVAHQTGDQLTFDLPHAL